MYTIYRGRVSEFGTLTTNGYKNNPDSKMAISDPYTAYSGDKGLINCGN